MQVIEASDSPEPQVSVQLLLQASSLTKNDWAVAPRAGDRAARAGRRSLPLQTLWVRRACFSFAPCEWFHLSRRVPAGPGALPLLSNPVACFAFCALLSLRSGWALVPCAPWGPVAQGALIPLGP